ncbi:MAG: URC4/urg3 family protein [Leptolyngbyaceae cyanobacterium CSU_1_4]|nr:URC4/urg3 family protein [Leptolyngbyaceae cyanobacterium CSU_1_4]
MHAPIAYLRSPQGIRDRCGQLFTLAQNNKLQHFQIDLDCLDRTADYVIEVMRSAYPTLQIPFHSRWRHFEAGGISRCAQLDQHLDPLNPLEKAQAKFDLVIPSVLLDAGAGAHWQYLETATGQTFQRSEGLGVASFHLFLQSAFSSIPHRLQTDAVGLQNLTEAKLVEGFQVSDRNPLVGVAGRLKLMQRLGAVLSQSPHLFSSPSPNETPRLGYLVNYLVARALRDSRKGSQSNQLEAQQVFEAVLEGFSDIWEGRIVLDHTNLGDVWFHSALPDRGAGSQLVPFHKLSQWLTYSLLEPLQELGLTITHLDQLTGLSEYRNGGLCVDLGLLRPKHSSILQLLHSPDSEVIVEWRALTVILLDRIAATVRQKLGMDAQSLPLVKVLEGGTWAAGRKIAAELRPRGAPPIQIVSDGTVF